LEFTRWSAKSEKGAHEGIRQFEGRLESAGLLGALTSREKIKRDLKTDPKAHDYSANDSSVWGDDHKPPHDDLADAGGRPAANPYYESRRLSSR
jgi:hypothetical protein